MCITFCVSIYSKIKHTPPPLLSWKIHHSHKRDHGLMKRQRAKNQLYLGWKPTSATHCCVTLGALFNFSELQALYL